MRECPKCGTENLSDVSNCQNCQVNLVMARKASISGSKPSTSKVLSIGGILLWAVLALGVAKYRTILDFLILQFSNPTTEVQALAAKAGMSKEGEKIYLVARPQLDSAQQIQKDCPFAGEKFGCYASRRIYILKITHPELVSNMEVTAAHEMLHAAYERLSKSERTALDVELEAEFKRQNNQELADLLTNSYKAGAASYERSTELHSFIGTEFRSISPKLEQHYKRYFSNRLAVVEAHDLYREAFEGRKAALEQRLYEITSNKAQLVSLSRQLNVTKAELEAVNAQLEAYRANNQSEEYNALVPRQNALVRQYNSLVAQHNALAKQVNSEVNEYNQLVGEYNALARSISQELSETKVD